MSTVVIGYDASPAARKAVELAVARTTPEDKLIIVHAYGVPAEYAGASYYQDLVNRALDRAGAVMDDIERDCPSLAGRDWEPDVLQGEPGEALCRVAHHRRADEIVLGTRGVGRFVGLLGSVAHEVLHRAECPVLVIPERAVKAQAKAARVSAAA